MEILSLFEWSFLYALAVLFENTHAANPLCCHFRKSAISVVCGRGRSRNQTGTA